MNTLQGRPIGVFDSGLGGLTVVKELTKVLPHESFIYVGDTARVPYGTKSPETIQKYALQISFFLLQKKVKALIVACNSVSAVALPALQDLPIPVLGVIESGARAAVLSSKNMTIGIIGTRATVQSGAYKKAIRSYSPKAKVIEAACPLFVPLVEEGWTQHAVTRRVAREYLTPLLTQGMDTLVLGCTHYPLLRKTLQSVIGKHVRLIDSAEQTAKDAVTLLQKNGLNYKGGVKPKHKFYVTDTPTSFTQLGQAFLGRPLSPVQRLRFESL